MNIGTNKGEKMKITLETKATSLNDISSLVCKVADAVELGITPDAVITNEAMPDEVEMTINIEW